MKRILFILTMICILTTSDCNAQLLKDLKNIFGKSNGLSEQDAAAGIREALIKGTQVGVDMVSQIDGYFGNPDIRIPFPPEAQNIESTLRNIGLGSKVDEAILAVNRAAEMAASDARPIFVAAITGMTIKDALNIVKGSENAATIYLKETTSVQLQEAFLPVISGSLEKVEATRYWDDVINSYNRVPFVKKMDPDLASYVTAKAIEGLFMIIAKEELRIRKDPVARTTELLQKVFGSN